MKRKMEIKKHKWKLQIKHTLLFLFVLFLLMPLSAFAGSHGDEELSPGRRLAKQTVKDRDHWITADHAKFEVL